jgi:hypothetical protein
VDIYSPPVRAQSRYINKDKDFKKDTTNATDLLQLDEDDSKASMPSPPPSSHHSSSFPGKFLRITTSKHAWLCEGNATDLSRRLLQSGYEIKSTMRPNDGLLVVSMKKQASSSKVSTTGHDDDMTTQTRRTTRGLILHDEGSESFDILARDVSWRLRSIAAPHLATRAVTAIDLLNSIS